MGKRKRRLLSAFEVEEALRDATQEEILQQLDRYQSQGLVKLVDSRVDANAEAALDILLLRGDAALLAEGVASRVISTRSGRIRALQVLLVLGNRCPAAREAYLAAVRDSSSDVVNLALRGLAFLQDDSVLPQLIEARRILASFRRRIGERLDRLIEALEKKDPRIYDPSL